MRINETELNKVLQNLNIETLNTMQLAALEADKKDQDFVLLSPTGSGKTLGFLLPVLNSLNASQAGIQALILTPSRELALQIEQVFRKMGSNYKVNCCYGGHDVAVEKNNLKHPPALLIGTPGRIADHLKRGRIDALSIKTLVLDEFDKSLEFGFQEDMGFIINELHSLKKRILTSATQAIEIPDFTGISNPITLNFLKDTPAQGLCLKSIKSEGTDKLDALFKLICKLGNDTSLVFCNHIDTVERISSLLKDKELIHDVFHGGLKQEDREKALIKFRNGSSKLLITTDLAARGLDIPEIKNIIHYQLPHKEDGFIHRNGRTARMNASGTSYLLLSENDFIPDYIKQKPIEEALGQNTKLPDFPDWATIYIGGGRKDKISKMDIVGLLLQKGNLLKEELGLIELQDFSAFAAVKRSKIRTTVELLKAEKLKKKKYKIEISD